LKINSFTAGSLNFVTTFQTLFNIWRSDGVDAGGDNRRERPRER